MHRRLGPNLQPAAQCTPQAGGHEPFEQLVHVDEERRRRRLAPLVDQREVLEQEAGQAERRQVVLVESGDVESGRGRAGETKTSDTPLEGDEESQQPATVLREHPWRRAGTAHRRTQVAVLEDVRGELVEPARHRATWPGWRNDRGDVDPASKRRQQLLPMGSVGAKQPAGQRCLRRPGEERRRPPAAGPTSVA